MDGEERMIPTKPKSDGFMLISIVALLLIITVHTFTGNIPYVTMFLCAMNGLYSFICAIQEGNNNDTRRSESTDRPTEG